VPALSQRRIWLVTAALALGMVMALLDATIMSIAVPSIVWDLNTSIPQVAWVLNGYNLGLAVLFLPMGRVADRFGRKRVFLFGLVAFAFFSYLCGHTTTIHTLIGARIGQAIGAACIVPVSLAILLEVFPAGRRGFASGLFGAITSLAAALGPVAGGLIIKYLTTWRWIFYINVPLGLVALVACFFLIPGFTNKTTKTAVDYLGLLLVSAGLFCLTLAIIQGNEWRWDSFKVLGLFALSAATLTVFGWWELRTREPMIDLRLFRRRAFTAANAAVATVDLAMMGCAFLLVIFVVGVLDWTELKAAIAITPMPLAGLVLAPFSGRLVDRFGPRLLAAGGALLSAAGLFLLARIDLYTRSGDVAWRCAIVGAGFGLSLPALMAAGMSALPHRARGVGSGALNTARQLGFVFGVAILVAVFSHTAAAAAWGAAADARVMIQQQALLPAADRAEMLRRVDAAAHVDISKGITEIRKLGNPTAGEPQPKPGTVAAYLVDAATLRLKFIFRSWVVNSFDWPLYTAAIAALISLVPALLLPRRLTWHDAGEDDEPAAAGERARAG
jgi:EmrB/QacA subfamily drug resistance transporter